MNSSKITKGLFNIIIEESNSEKLTLSWDGDILEFRNDGTSDCLYLTVNDEFLKIIEMHELFAYIITSHRNKIPIYYRYINNRYYISNSVYCLVCKNDNIKLDSFSLASTLTNIADPKLYFTNIFKDILLLKSSSTYIIKQKNISYKTNYYSQYFNNKNNKNKNDLVELLYIKYENICKKYENIHLFLSAGYDSRLELALLINHAKKYKNVIKLHHYSEFGHDHDIVSSIAKDYKLDLVLYNGEALFDRGVVSFSSDKRVLQYNSGPCQIGLYHTFEALNNIKDSSNDSVFLVNNVGALKGRYYPQIEKSSLITFMCDLLYVNRENFEKIKSRLNINMNYKDFSMERQSKIDDILNILEEIKDIYAKFDISYAMIFHSNLFGKRMHTLMMLENCAFPIDDDMVWLIFSNLRKEDKIGAKFIKYAIKKVENKLNNYKYISGNYDQISTNNFPIWLQKPINHSSHYVSKFLNKTKNNRAIKPEFILSSVKNDDVRSMILLDIRKHILDENLTYENLTSSLYSLQIFEFLKTLE